MGRVRGWAFGLLKLTPEQFRTMRQGWFWEALAVCQEERENDRRHLGELVRGATLRLWNLQVRKEDKIRDAAKFWPMPWDTNEDEELRRLQAMTHEEKTRSAVDFMERIGWDIDG